jgi:hypothetical protein
MQHFPPNAIFARELQGFLVAVNLGAQDEGVASSFTVLEATNVNYVDISVRLTGHISTNNVVLYRKKPTLTVGLVFFVSL